MIANASHIHRTVRHLPDSHPNRPSRPVPSRPITTWAEAPSIGSVVEGRRRAGWMAADAAIGGVR